MAAYQWFLREITFHLLFLSPSQRAIAIDSTFLRCHIQVNLQELGCLASLANHTRTGNCAWHKLSVLFCTNPFDIVFNSKFDVNLFPNVLVTQLTAFLFFAAGTSSPIHSAVPPSLNKYIHQIENFETFVHAFHNPPTNRQKTRDVVFERLSPSHEKSVSGKTLSEAISLLRLEMYTV